MNTTITIHWTNRVTQAQQTYKGTLPLTIGRAGSGAMVELGSRFVSSNHAYLKEEAGQLVILDLGSRNGTAVNQTPLTKPTPITEDDTIQIGPFELTVALEKRPFSPQLPPRFNQPIVPLASLGNVEIETVPYLAIGGGLGSFTWVDHLRIGGVPADQIVSIGFEEKPYGRYRRLCQNSQIPNHERLRSNSDSCPDNIWGWPGYGVREMARSAGSGRVGQAARVGWQLFNEPLVQTYTPQSGRVFASIDREAARIDWSHIWRRGRVRAIRKADNGRFLIAYTHMLSNGTKQHRLIMAEFIHLAVGYPGVRFLPDLQAYREATGDFTRVVNAYESHEHLYRTLAERGGTVLIRGRGIVASRIIQRINEVRQTTTQTIRVIHLMRSPNEAGNRHGAAQRLVAHHWEHQPFNWPKAAWGGDLRQRLADAPIQQQQSLYAQWGGTTTADRTDWRQMIDHGLQEGWYQIQFGAVDQVVAGGNGRLCLTVHHPDTAIRQSTIEAHFIVDATGLESDVRANGLLDDLIETYRLPLNPQGRLCTNAYFEMNGMRHGNGRIYASGIITLGNHYAPVDSFLGLQYAALQSVDDLAQHNAPGLRRINGVRSLSQWTRWAIGATP